MKIVVRKIQPAEYGHWNELVNHSPQGSVFLRSDFLQMVCETNPTVDLVIIGCFTNGGVLKAGQALHYRKLFGVPINYYSQMFYNGPLLSTQHGKSRASTAEENYEYICALANYLTKNYPNVPFDTHPTLHDVRPFQRLGWRMAPRYTHVWNLKTGASFIDRMAKDERWRAHKALKRFTFQVEQWCTTRDDFLPVLLSGMNRYCAPPDERWKSTFFQRVNWMETHGLCRFITARKPNGELVGGGITVLSHEDDTGYLWRVGYLPEWMNDGIAPGLYLATLNSLAPEFTYADASDGVNPGLERFKDSVGSVLAPFYSATSPRCRYQFYSSLRQINWRLKKIIKKG